MQDIDNSNTANSKRIYYLTNVSNADIDPATCPDAGYLALINCTGTTVKDFNFTSNNDGAELAYSTNCTLTNMTIQDNRVCITNTLFNESYFSNYGGLTLFESQNNVITNSIICNNTCGVCLCHSNGNTFYHNAFVANGKSAVTDRDTPFENVSLGSFSSCTWNNRLEGNYWSNYNGTDSFNGSSQNKTGSDGIGDVPYVIDANNTDYFPLMGMFSSFGTLQGYPVNIISNSTISGFVSPIWLEHPEVVTLTFNVTGTNGSTGFCRVSIPTAMMNDTYHVSVNGTEIPCTLLPCSNANMSYLYFTYKHSTEQVIILPEFPSFLVLSLFMIATLLAVIINKEKQFGNAFSTAEN